MQAVFPARLLDLEGLGITEPAAEAPNSRPAAVSAEAADDYRGTTVSASEPGAADQDDILIVSEIEAEASLIAAVLEANGLSARRVSFRDNLKSVLPGRFKAVFLVMQRVDEQAFGMAIKISSSSSLPLIAAGPEWTRSKVLKAVRYGVTDILLTPAEPADVEEKIRTNILSLAA
jgi:PleD family two-component response regulator